MHEVKDTRRARVRIGYDGRVHKYYLGPEADKRYANEVTMLKHLEAKGCPFVPRLLEEHPEELYIVTTNCGNIAEQISSRKMASLYKELENYGIKHGDAFPRNITYDARSGRFCIIDFEFATNLETGEGLVLEDIKRAYDTKLFEE
ncbi:MAG: serine/threonine protein phosphatase [Opitutales bacterium]|nr:serine/threonine protein phosphatase [Opitutales bacterium]